jgi:hypothetical protein
MNFKPKFEADLFTFYELILNFTTMYLCRYKAVCRDKLPTYPDAKPVTDVMILKIFSSKNLAKILAFSAQTTVLVFAKILS